MLGLQSYLDMARFTLTYPSNRRRRRSLPRIYGPTFVDTNDPYSAPYLLQGQKDHVHLGHVGHDHKPRMVTHNRRQVLRRYTHEEL